MISNGDGRGGGLYLYDSQYEISNNVITNNAATHGGGIRITATLGINSAEGLTSEEYSVALGLESISSNIFNRSYPFNNDKGLNKNQQITNSLMYNIILNNNVSGYGGGLNMTNSNPQILKCNISNNFAGLDGGGVVLGNSDPVLINNTIANNNAAGLGSGGIDLYKNSDPIVENTILYGNKNSRGYQQIHLKVGSCDPDFFYCNIQNGKTAIAGRGSGIYYSGVFENCIDVDPDFIDTVEYHLSTNSSCIDAGNPNPNHNDIEDPNNVGYPLWPATGTLLNDMGVYGGNPKVITGLEKERFIEYPEVYALLQNYPNPFNPSTTIGYRIPKTSNIELSIYNVIGQKVVTLINKTQPAGIYQIPWDASGFSSGVYYYSLTTSLGYSKSRKMLLVK
jgi:hypothetical protein